MTMIWESTLDGFYQCEVTRIDADHGRLTVTDPDGKRLLDDVVPLAYGAQFGPDVDDVRAWELRCIDAIDDGEDYHPMFPIEPGTPEEEEETVQRVAEFLQGSIADLAEDDVRAAAIELIAKMRDHIKSEQKLDA